MTAPADQPAPPPDEPPGPPGATPTRGPAPDPGPASDSDFDLLDALIAPDLSERDPLGRSPTKPASSLSVLAPAHAALADSVLTGPLVDDGPETESSAAPAPDPWAHRRGEPRVFAFFWTFYVLLAVAGSLSWVARFTTITAGTYGPAARIMLVVVAVGMIVLWPMTRLSQASPTMHPALASFLDLLVVQAPVQIVVWPLVILAGWPADIVLGLSAMFAAWGVLTGGVVAVGLSGRSIDGPRDRGLWERSGWMLVALGLAFGAVLMQWLLTALGRAVPAWVLMSSPVTAIPALTGRGLSGPSAPVSRVQWDTIVGTLSLAVLLWSAAVARYGFRRAPEAE